MLFKCCFRILFSCFFISQYALAGNILCTKNVSPIVVFDMRYLLEKDLTDINNVEMVWDQLHLVSTLQGIVNRNKPSLFIKYVKEGEICVDEYWWNKYRKEGEWLSQRDTIQLTSLMDVLAYFKKDIKGLVVYDSDVPSTSNVASSIAGIEDVIAVRYDSTPNSLYQNIKKSDLNLKEVVRLINNDGTSMFTGKGFLPGLNIRSSGSVKNDPYLWFIEKYMKLGRSNTKYGAYYIDQYWRKKPLCSVPNHHTLTNHDFFVSKRAFFFDLSPWGDEPATDDLNQKVGTDLETLKQMLLIAYKQNKGIDFCYIGGFPSWAFKYTKHAEGMHDDVPTEWEFSKIISAYNAFKDADAIGYGALANASFWQHFPLEKEYKQSWVSRENLINKGYLDEDGYLKNNGKNYLIFYVGDYDASSWITQRTPTIWDDSNRGKLPLMWCISPVLQERVPMVLHNFRKTATKNDYFASADNGAGYLMPGMLQEPRDISGLPSGLNAWAKHCKKYYKKWGLTITGFVIDGEAPGLNEEGLDCYRSFSYNGIVPQKVPLTYLHRGMPVLRADADVNEEPQIAAQRIVDRINKRNIPFHWFRNILKTPTWYIEVMAEIKKLDNSIELVDAPTFFELYKIYLEQNPKAAAGLLE